MAFSNQITIKIEQREAFNKSNLYCMFHLDAMQLAMQTLKGETLKLWLYLSKNQDNYQFDLSQKALEEWGLKKDAYYTAVKKLKELNYLTPVREGSNIYYFSEKPKTARNSEKPKEVNTAETARNSEKPKDFSEKPKNFSEKPKNFSQKAKNLSEKPQRNNTIIQNNTDIEQASSAPQKNPSLAPSAPQKSLQKGERFKGEIPEETAKKIFKGLKYTIEDGYLRFAEGELNHGSVWKII